MELVLREYPLGMRGYPTFDQPSSVLPPVSNPHSSWCRAQFRGTEQHRPLATEVLLRQQEGRMEGHRLSPADVFRHDRVNILGVGVSAINLDDAVATIERWIGERSRNYVCITGAHGLMESRCDERLRRIHNEAGMVTPDGMPLVWFSHLSGKHRTERVCGSDLMQKMTAVSQLRGYRQFYYGGAEGVADTLKHVLISSHPGL